MKAVIKTFFKGLCVVTACYVAFYLIMVGVGFALGIKDVEVRFHFAVIISISITFIYVIGLGFECIKRISESHEDDPL